MNTNFGTVPDGVEPQDTASSFFALQDNQSWLGDFAHSRPEVTISRLQLPSFADSISSFSELSEQGLTQGSTLSTAFDEHTSHETHPNQFEVSPETLKQSCDDLNAPKVDLQCIGQAPEIFVNGQVALPPELPFGDEYSTNLMPRGYTRSFNGGCGVPLGLSSGMDEDRVSSTGSSEIDLSYSNSFATELLPPSSKPMVRGRSGGLSREAREKAASMRYFKACDCCRIRRVEVRTH